MVVVAGSRGVGRAVTLTSGLDPDDGVDERRAGAGCWAGTEASALDVAPVTPLLTETGDGIAASVDDGVVGEASRLQGSRELGDVRLLVLARVVLGVRRVGELTGLLVPVIRLTFLSLPKIGSRTETYQEFQPAMLVA